MSSSAEGDLAAGSSSAEGDLADGTGMRPTVRFDHHSPEFAKDPWPLLRELRETCPVAWSDTYDGFWVLTRYEDVKEVARDDETFSSAENGILIPPKKNREQRSLPIECDPPVFLEYRRILQPLFSPFAVDRLVPVIETAVRRCIDDFIEAGECDFVHDLADPVPAMTTLHKLGLPAEEWKTFVEPLHMSLFLRQDNPRRQGTVEGIAAINGILVDAIAERRAHPRDDMITYLTQARVDGRPTTDEEVLQMVQLTIQGGFDTTGSAIGSALVQLDLDRDARQRLIEEPDRLRVAVEEFLRYEAPQIALARTATRDVEIGGQVIRKGERLLLVWASGNRDEAAFPDGEDVVIDRFPNRHMTFGLGAHRCLGSTMARRMIHAALAAVLRRLPDYEIDHDRIERAETIGVVYGRFAVPGRFTPGPRHN